MFEPESLMKVGNIKDFVMNKSEVCMQHHDAAQTT